MAISAKIRNAIVMIARADRIYIIIKVNKLLSFFRCGVEDVASVFLSSYRNTRESLGELETGVETLACLPTVLVPPNFHSCFYSSIETRYMFSVS